MDNLGCLGQFSYLLLTCERHAEHLQELFTFFVRLSGRGKYDLHTSDLINFIVIDFWENQLFGQAEAVVAATIEAFARNTMKVSNARQCDVEQTVNEFIHAVTAKGYFNADWHAFTNLKPAMDFLARVTTGF